MNNISIFNNHPREELGDRIHYTIDKNNNYILYPELYEKNGYISELTKKIFGEGCRKRGIFIIKRNEE